MSSPLLNSQAEIIKALIIALGLGKAPVSGTVMGVSDWPVYSSSEPNKPDNCITVYDTSNQVDGRSMNDGTEWEHFGFQVRVRSVDHPTGYVKAKAIKEALLTQVGGSAGSVSVICGTNPYLVHAVTKLNGPLVLGKDSPNTKRSLFTLNGFLVL